jgi:multidrug efflux system membrane fusion protein
MLHKDAAQLVSAQADLQRYAALVPEGFQTRQIYDQQVAQVGQLRASIEADQAQIDAAQLNLDYAAIRSPIEGRTGARLVDLGNMVRAAAGSGLVTITQLRPIFVSFAVPQQVLRVVKQNQANAPLAVLAWSQDDREKLAEGTLTLIDNQVDPTTGTVRLKATFPNDDEMLWPGEECRHRPCASDPARAERALPLRRAGRRHGRLAADRWGHHRGGYRRRRQGPGGRGAHCR